MDKPLAHMGLDIRPWVRHFQKLAKGEMDGLRYGRNGRKMYVVDMVEKSDVNKNPKVATVEMVTPVQRGLEQAKAKIAREHEIEADIKES